MRIKLFFIITISILFCKNMLAQVVDEDVVNLKNGSVIHGLITELIPNISITIQTNDKNIFVFKMDEIVKITKDKKAVESYKHENKAATGSIDQKNEPYSGYIFTVENQIGQGANISQDNAQKLATHIINGFIYENLFSIGIGSGFDYIKDFNGTIINSNGNDKIQIQFHCNLSV